DVREGGCESAACGTGEAGSFNHSDRFDGALEAVPGSSDALVTAKSVFFEPPQEPVEAAFAAVRVLADVVDPSLGQSGVQLGAGFGRARAECGLFGRGGLEQIGGKRQHA